MFDFGTSSLFSMGNNNSSSMGLDFSTLASIRNGTYKKLLRSYYGQNGNNKTSGTSTNTKVNNFDNGIVDTNTSKNKVNATTVRDNASDLSDAYKSMNKQSVWEKKNVKNEDGTFAKNANGTIKQEYDKDAIYKEVSDFVKKYNELVGSTADSNNTSVLRTAANMVNNTKANKDALARIGVSITKDNKLQIDEKAFKEADMASVKSLFAGTGSYARSVSSSATMIYGSAVSQLAQMSTSNMYNSSGSYSYLTGSTYNRFM